MRSFAIAAALVFAGFVGSALALADDAGTVPAAVDDSVGALQAAQAEQLQKYQAINALNPLSQDYGKNVAGVEPTPAPVVMPASVEAMRKLLANPAIQGYLKFFNSPAFTEGITKLAESPNRMKMLYSEIGWIVFMLIFKAWRMSKAKAWYGRLWTRSWTFFMGWAGLLIVIPSVVFGDGYMQTISKMFDVFRHT